MKDLLVCCVYRLNSHAHKKHDSKLDGPMLTRKITVYLWCKSWITTDI